MGPGATSRQIQFHITFSHPPSEASLLSLVSPSPHYRSHHRPRCDCAPSSTSTPTHTPTSTMAETYAELKVAALDLRGRRLDPFAVLMRIGRGHGAGWEEVQRTEVVWGEGSPAFVQSFDIALYGDASERMEWRLGLYSKSSRSDELRKNTFLGYSDFTLERMFCKVDGVIERVLRSRSGKNDGKRGRLIICGEKIVVSDVKHMFSIQFGFGAGCGVWGPEGGKKAKKVFYVIYRAILNGVADEDWAPVYRSEILDPYAARNVSLNFEGASIRAEDLYGMDENRGLRFEIFHYSPSGPHIPLGFVQTSAGSFKFAKPGGKLYMIPVAGSGLRAASVSLDMAKIGLTTRRGGVSSVFCLRAEGFTWGGGKGDGDGDDYLERDVYGRKRIEWDEDNEPTMGLPRGVSYMGSRLNRVPNGNDSDADSTH